jgi:ABC-2 type transport system ATP-binding protein
MAEISNPAPILAAEGVIAGYGGRPIIKGVDLVLRRGEILGLLGANGAGKSTLVKALTGQLRLTSGKVTVAGIDMAEAPERAKAELGLAVDIGEVPTALTGRQYLELVASIRGCAADAWPADDLVATLNLERWIDRPIATYSLGTRMKISIAASLLGSPPLIIFDESLNGLDPVAAFNMKRMIKSLAATGRHAIILATHVVETIPSLCTRAIFLAGGMIARSWDGDALVAAGATPGEFETEVIAALGEKEPA